jgi:hypothetical protein
MENEKIKLSLEEARDIVYDDHESWECVHSEISGNWRHGTENTGVYRRPDGRFYKIEWRDSTSDMSGFEDCNYAPMEAIEVFPEKVTTIVYTEKQTSKTASIDLENIKCSDGWAELCADLGYGEGTDHSKCNEMFEYGEYGSITIEVDKDFNIVGGMIHKTGK